MLDSTSEDAMADFILTNGKNLRTALLIHKSIPLIAERLVSDVAKRIEHGLADEPGWKVVRNTLASKPNEQHVELKWAPIEWEHFGWGISLSPQKGRARDFIFGIFAVSAGNGDPGYTSNPAKYPTMPDADRDRLGAAIAPLLNSVGDRDRGSAWWPRYTNLRTINNWMNSSVLMKIAHANGISSERDLVSGKQMDQFVIDLFRAAKAVIADVPDVYGIQPSPSL
jgi:hypothetical protein